MPSTVDLAIQASRSLGWRYIQVDEERFDSDKAYLEKPNGFRVYIKLPYKKVYLEVSPRLDNLGDAITQETKNRETDGIKTTCQPTLDALLRAIEKITLQAEPIYLEFVDRINKEKMQEQIAEQNLDVILKALSGARQTKTPWNRDKLLGFTYTNKEFRLDGEVDDNKISLKGYSNSIPVDLFLKLVPVIQEWEAEQS